MGGHRTHLPESPRTGDLGPAIAAVAEQLYDLQLAQLASRRRAIVLFEGPEGSGKKYALRQLAAAFDPCHYAVHVTPYDRRESCEGHWLARFWRQLPGAGSTAIYCRSWYRRVLDDLVLGRTEPDTVARVYDEINEFEAQQRDHGTLIVKLFFEVSAEIQEQRLAERAQNPWRRIIPGDEPVLVSDAAYAPALAELRANSDTRWSPWRTIDGNDERHAALAALEAIAEAWAQAMPSEPPHLVSAGGRAA